jgi:hypothetical protein
MGVNYSSNTRTNLGWELLCDWCREEIWAKIDSLTKQHGPWCAYQPHYGAPAKDLWYRHCVCTGESNEVRCAKINISHLDISNSECPFCAFICKAANKFFSDQAKSPPFSTATEWLDADSSGYTIGLRLPDKRCNITFHGLGTLYFKLYPLAAPTCATSKTDAVARKTCLSHRVSN